MNLHSALHRNFGYILILTKNIYWLQFPNICYNNFPNYDESEYLVFCRKIAVEVLYQQFLNS